MKPKTRKIFSRIGAALMLGLSLFSFGMTLRGQGKAKPKKAKNIRFKEQEQLQQEQQQIANMAEQEALAVLEETQASESQEQQRHQREAQQEQQTLFETVLRYGVVGIWAVSATLFFTSAIFNKPFGLGKAALSLLPGNPHTAIITLRTDSKYYQEGDAVEVQAWINSNGEPLEFVKLFLAFDKEKVEFEKFQIREAAFDRVVERKINPEEGTVMLALRKSRGVLTAENQKIASFHFRAKEKTAQTPIALSWENSLVVKDEAKEDASYNILGKAVQAEFKILPASHQEVSCHSFAVNEVLAREEWERLIKGSPVGDGKNNWVQLQQESGGAFLCGYTEKRLLLLLGLPREEDSYANLEVKLGSKIQKKSFSESLDQWQMGSQKYWLFSFNRPEEQYLQEAQVTLKDRHGNQEVWPSRGRAKLKLTTE
jgi:hypothetical protein